MYFDDSQYLLETMGNRIIKPTVIYEDNMAAITLTENSKNHERTKHIALRWHSTREFIAKGYIQVKYKCTQEMIADTFTKPLSRLKFEEFRAAIGIEQVEIKCSIQGSDLGIEIAEIS